MKLIIFDRDGTINFDRDDYVTTADEWIPIPGAVEAMATLTQAGWHAVIATNQSGIGRGLFDMATLNAMHLKLTKLLAAAGGRIDAVFFCPHVPSDECDCRKPMPGLYRQIGERYGMDLKQVPAVGDSLRDLQAAHAAGCEPHLVRTGKCEPLDEEQLAALVAQVPNTQVHADLTAFAEFILQREQQQQQQQAQPPHAQGRGTSAGRAE
jgi:D-glycero-D-manno-heptose 1,7-bisphosphate phosphatase